MKYKMPKPDKKYCPGDECNYVVIEQDNKHKVHRCTKCGRLMVT